MKTNIIETRARADTALVHDANGHSGRLCAGLRLWRAGGQASFCSWRASRLNGARNDECPLRQLVDKRLRRRRRPRQTRKNARSSER